MNNPKIIGIVNVTPDSFSDGGQYFNPLDAVSKCFELAEQGADIVDVGAESTRPNAETITPYEEILRLLPVVKELKENGFKIPISIDTRNFETAKKLCEQGINILNDVGGFADERMIALIKDFNLQAIFMHSLTIPADKEIVIDADKDIIAVLKIWLEQKLKLFAKYNVPTNKMIFDPGLGFGKTAKQSFEIVKRIDELKEFGVKILIGHSEKSMYSLFTDLPAGKRNIETQITSAFLTAKNVDYIRVHKVADAKRTIKIAKELF